MVFSSLTFLFYFLPAVLACYFFARTRNRKNVVLLLFSILFYAWGEPFYVFLIVLSTVNDYVCSNRIQMLRDKRASGEEVDMSVAESIRCEKRWFLLSVVINLALLGVFKYADFMIANVNDWFGTQIAATKLPLPIGISFYTFQTMSYSIDVYFGKVRAQRNFITLATYVALFPQLIAGPIVRYQTIEKELDSRCGSLADTADGMRRFILGLAKKVLLANPMGLITDTIFVSQAMPKATAVLWLGVIAYSFQIYFDFSGYSDMAIGLGRVFGFHFLENFNYPYMADSITDFWRRWHISLGTWFRDYVYIPLGGNRNHQYLNIAVVWFLTGLWHGASWNYVLWGIYYGCLLIVEKILKNRIRLPRGLRRMLTLLAVVIGWTIFRLENIDDLRHVLYYLWHYHPIMGEDFVVKYDTILFALPMFLPAVLASIPWWKKSIAKGEWQKAVLDIYLMVLLILIIQSLTGSAFNPFIYFRF